MMLPLADQVLPLKVALPGGKMDDEGTLVTVEQVRTT